MTAVEVTYGTDAAAEVDTYTEAVFTVDGGYLNVWNVLGEADRTVRIATYPAGHWTRARITPDGSAPAEPT